MIDCTKQYTIKVTEGNAFGLLLTLKTRTFVSSQPVDADIDASELQDIVVKLNNQEFTDHTEDENGVLLAIPADLARGTYNVELTATYNGIEIRAAYFECFTIMPWSYQSDAQNYIPGSPIVAEAAYIVSDIISDEELERLKAEYRQKISEAEAAAEAAEEAKQEWEEKAEQLDDVASETNATANKNAVLADIEAAKAALQGGDTTATLTALKNAIAHIDIDTSELAKQGSDPSVNITDMNTKLGDVESALEYMEGGGLPDIAAIAKQGTNASATLTTTQAAVVDGNDTAISVSKEVRSEVGTGSDTAAETGTLFAILKWVKDKVKSIFNLIGSPASGQPSTLFEAIAAGGGGGGGDAQESTSQEILAKVNAFDAAFVQRIYDGIEFSEVVIPLTFLNILTNANKIIKITDDKTTGVTWSSTFFANFIPNLEELIMPELLTYTGTTAFGQHNHLKKIEMRKLQSATASYAFHRANALEEIYLDNITSITQNYAFNTVDNLRICYIPKMNTFWNGTFSGAPKLIDLTCGTDASANIVLSSWSPTEALSNSSSSLVEPGETFANNLEKLLYNIREHIAANLPDLTGLSSLTITFSAAVKSAIQADAPTAAVFTNKNWTIA